MSKYGISNYVLCMIFLPLVAVLMNKTKVRVTFGIILGITGVVRVFVRQKTQWDIFISKEGEATYIYEQISRFNSESKLIGESSLMGDMPNCLLEYKNGTILTTYGIEYGILVKIIVAVLGVVIFQMIRTSIV